MKDTTLKHLVFTPTLNAPVAKVQRVQPKTCGKSQECSLTVKIGIFFDGTNNHIDNDKNSLSHTNIARLFTAYLDRPKDGIFPHYIPGVGTIFPEIGEFEAKELTGSGLGWGCEDRILYGLLMVLNSIHLCAFGQDNPMFTKDQIRILCSNDSVTDGQEKALLLLIGMEKGLKTDKSPQKSLDSLVKLLADKLNAPSTKVKVLECTIDVFGYSRGAAQARVFCTWLHEVIDKGKLAGVITHIRFVGLFDTVASYGLVVDAFTNETRGHSGWAEPKNLQVRADYAQNCVHMVAMHELRANFPVDSIYINGQLPPHFCEFAYPGSHSDVGGGYAPGELGIAVAATPAEGDALKLSQITLNHMYDCAVKANVPLDKEFAKDKLHAYDPFAVSPRLLTAYTAFLKESTAEAKPDPKGKEDQREIELEGKHLHQWLQPYLNWHWLVRNRYRQTQQVMLADFVHQDGVKDRDLLLKAHAKFINDVKFINEDSTVSEKLFAVGQENSRRYKFSSMDEEKKRNPSDQTFKNPGFDPEAPMILKLVKEQAPYLSPSQADFFDQYVHDSYAGFCKSLTEFTGYWRYRKVFEGDNIAKLAALELTQQDVIA